MSDSNEILHSHAVMEQLLVDIQTHALLVASPLLSDREMRVVAEEMAAFVMLLDIELREHVAAEERYIYPELKQRLARGYQAPMQALYEEHRMLEITVTRLGFELNRSIRDSTVAQYSGEIVGLVHEVFDLFETHGVNEQQVFVMAGLGHAY